MRFALICAICTGPALAAESSRLTLNETDKVSLLVHSISVANTVSSHDSFAAFILDLGRDYRKGTDEYELRRKLYQQRLESVQRHNSNPNRRWDAAINHLSDRTEEELAQLRGLRVMQADSSTSAQSSPLALEEMDSVVLPDEKTWTNLNAVKADTAQGGCGSCWAIATATTLTANAEVKGHSHSFSAQELVDCVPNPHKCGGKGGCQGSTVELALNWVVDKGLATNSETPYKGIDTKCKKTGGFSFLSHDGNGDHKGATYNHAKLQEMIAIGYHGADTAASSALSLAGWERLPENKYEPVMRAVATVGPVAVSVDADKWSNYNSGVFDGCVKDAVINHAVTLVGYGKDKKTGDKYWTIKNSWGKYWGEDKKGIIRLLREEGSTAHCGVDHIPSVGTGCDNSPPSVKVCGMCGILYDAVVPHFHQKK